VITTTTPDVTGVNGLGASVYEGICAVQVETGTGGSYTYKSPINPVSYFAALAE
jgi:hypothetical protein